MGFCHNLMATSAGRTAHALGVQATVGAIMIPPFFEFLIILGAMLVGVVWTLHMARLERRGLLRHRGGLRRIVDPRPRRREEG